MTLLRGPSFPNPLLILQWLRAKSVQRPGEGKPWDLCDQPGYVWRTDKRRLGKFEQDWQRLSGPLDIDFVPPGIVLALFATLIQQVRSVRRGNPSASGECDALYQVVCRPARHSLPSKSPGAKSPGAGFIRCPSMQALIQLGVENGSFEDEDLLRTRLGGLMPGIKPLSDGDHRPGCGEQAMEAHGVDHCWVYLQPQGDVRHRCDPLSKVSGL